MLFDGKFTRINLYMLRMVIKLIFLVILTVKTRSSGPVVDPVFFTGVREYWLCLRIIRILVSGFRCQVSGVSKKLILIAG